MSYIDSNLMNGEQVVYRTQLHWIVFAWPIIWLVLAIVLFISGGAAGIGGLCLLLAIVTGVVSYINYKTSEFGVTSKRVLVKVGLIRRTSLEVLLSKVEGIQVDQGILGRILGFGTVRVSGTGGTKDPFHKITAPLELRRRVQEQVATVQEAK
jgi:uncharacterized membrane protein YdbT with pleckstrin-like domain